MTSFANLHLHISFLYRVFIFIFVFILAPFFVDREKMKATIIFKSKNPPTLACKAGGYPKPTVVWYKNDELASYNSGEISADSFTFKIKSPDGEPTAYKCVVTNKYGNISFTFKVTAEGKCLLVCPYMYMVQ